MPQRPSPSGAPPAVEEASAWAVEYAREPGPDEDPPPEGEVRVELLTDPWSVWCWGFEPVRRALQHRYPSITFRFLLGGMFERLPDPDRQGFDLDRFFATVNRTTGMPVSAAGLRDDRPRSTYPACVHLHAIRLLDAPEAPLALRKLREAAYLDGRNISTPEAGADIAEQVGVDRSDFLDALETGEPEREFKTRITALERQGLQAYPTLIVTGHEERTTVQGFQALPSVVAIAEQVSGRVHAAMPPPDLVEVLPEGQRVTTREVAEVLDTGIEDAYERLQDAEQDGLVKRERVERAHAWRRVEGAG